MITLYGDWEAVAFDAFGTAIRVLTGKATEKVIDFIERTWKSPPTSEDDEPQDLHNEEQIYDFLKVISRFTDVSIRRKVRSWAAENEPTLIDAEVEHLIAMVINLKNRAKSSTTSQHFAVYSHLSASELLKSIVKDIQPLRHKGEPVCLGQEWILTEFLGEGAFGEVWKATNKGMLKPRAVKFFSKRDSKALEREKESLLNLSTNLKHPNVIAYLDVVSNAEHPFVALEYADNGSLQDWIREPVGDLDPSTIMSEVVSGMAAAHENGIYHRDLKLANILLTQDAQHPIKVSDFGLAKLERPSSETSLTRHSLAGTAMYFPPEAMHSGAPIDLGKWDVFAIGVIWYQLLVREIERPPYDYLVQLRDMRIDDHTRLVISHCLASPMRRIKNAVDLKKHVEERIPPRETIPEGALDVQHIFREYHRSVVAT